MVVMEELAVFLQVSSTSFSLSVGCGLTRTRAAEDFSTFSVNSVYIFLNFMESFLPLCASENTKLLSIYFFF